MIHYEKENIYVKDFNYQTTYVIRQSYMLILTRNPIV